MNKIQLKVIPRGGYISSSNILVIICAAIKTMRLSSQMRNCCKKSFIVREQVVFVMFVSNVRGSGEE